MDNKNTRLPGLFGMYKDFCRTRHTCCASSDLLTNFSWPASKDTRESMFSRLFPIPVLQAAGPEEVNLTENQTNPLEGMVPIAKPEVIVTDKEVQDYISKLSGRDRLRTMFGRTHDKRLHPNLALVSASTTSSAVITFCFGYMAGGAAGREKHLMKSKAKTYKSKFFALRAYQDAMMMGGLKMGLKWAFKGGSFVFLFMMTSQTIATYRNKTSVWEYIAGGALTCSVLRANLGLKGLIGGGFIGLVLGTLGGSLMYLTLKLGHETQEQRHYREVYQHILDEREFGIKEEENVSAASIIEEESVPAMAAS